MDAIDDAARVAQALADPTRLRILIALNERPLCVCELVSLVEVGQPAVSRHLGILQSADLIVSSRDGRWVDYSTRRPARGSFEARALDAIRDLAARDPAARRLRSRAREADRRTLVGDGSRATRSRGCVASAETSSRQVN